MSDGPDLIIANLDAETSWGRRAGHVVRDLPLDVLARISLYGTLLRVLWPSATRLWTPAPVDPGCLREVPGLKEVRLLSGGLRKDDAARAGAWAAAPPWAGTEEQIDAATGVNHRCFGHELARRLGAALPGSAVVRSIAELHGQGALGGRWVLKAPYSTAGRDRIHGQGSSLDASATQRITRLIDAHGELLLEPWMERTIDLGRATDAGFRSSRTHVLHTDPRGRFLGVTVGAFAAWPAADGDMLAATAALVADRLEDAGYDGAFGIDAFGYVENGVERFHPLVEINARYTFGHVAHALRDRVATALWGADPGAVTLAFGDADEPSVTDDAIPLVGSADGVRMYAWLERTL